MSKKARKITAVLLAVVMMSSALGFSVFAETVYFHPSARTDHGPDYNKGRLIVNTVGYITKNLISALLRLFPNPDWTKIEDYVENTEFKGNGGSFNDVATADEWNAGYATRSILPEDILTNGYTKAGYFGNFSGTFVTEVLDDQCVRVAALDAGDGIALFLSLDAYGITNNNVLALREYLKSAIEGKNVISINVSATHCHSVADVHGLGTILNDAIKANLLGLVTRKAPEYQSVRPELLNSLFENAEDAVTEALENMKSGTLSYAAIDAADLIFDKQEPQAFDPNINHIKFVPDDGSSEMWMVNLGAHPTMMSSSDGVLSADYPGMLVKLAKEQCGANVAFYNGAEAAIGRQMPPLGIPETSYESVTRYAQLILDKIKAASPASYTVLEPILNIAQKEILLPVNNPMLWAFCKFQVVNNTMIATSNKVDDALGATEIGICELGKTLAIFILPGEFSAEIFWGGTQRKDLSWNNAEWEYAPLADSFPGKHVIAFGLTNDMIGYIVPDNDYAKPLADSFAKYLGENNKHYEELLSTHSNAASNFVKEYLSLIDSVK